MIKSKFKFFSKQPPSQPKTKEEKSPKTVLPPFLEAIKAEAVKLKKLKASKQKFSADYEVLLEVANEDDIIGMFDWLYDNATQLQGLSPTNPKVFLAMRDHRAGDHPYPINIHVTMPVAGHVYIEFDHNSQLPREQGSTAQKKRPEPEEGYYPWKYIAEGAQKKLRRACTFDCTNRTVSRSAASVATGAENVASMRRARALYQSDNPYLAPTRYSREYISHPGGEVKAIAFAPLASGTWLDMIDEPQLYPYVLADIPWMLYAAAAGLEKFHNLEKRHDGLERLHRDIKPENYLLFRTPYGPSPYLNDLELGLFLKETKSAREAGTPAYIAFDRPCFNKLIELHNAVLKEIEKFKNIEDEKQLSLEEKVRFKKYTEFALKEEGSSHYDSDVAYMHWRLVVLMQPFLEKSDGFMKGFSFICQEKNPIKINTELSHHKDDVWSLCSVAANFLDSFCQQQEYKDNKPKIIADFQALMEKNLRAQRDARATAGELRSSIEGIIEESDRQECRDKFTQQLQYHQRKEPSVAASASTVYTEAKKTQKTPESAQQDQVLNP